MVIRAAASASVRPIARYVVVPAGPLVPRRAEPPAETHNAPDRHTNPTLIRHVHQQVPNIGDAGAEASRGSSADDLRASVSELGSVRESSPDATSAHSRMLGTGWRARKPLGSGHFSEAADGTRTHDLLHGKQNPIRRWAPLFACKRRSSAPRSPEPNTLRLGPIPWCSPNHFRMGFRCPGRLLPLRIHPRGEGPPAQKVHGSPPHEAFLTLSLARSRGHGERLVPAKPGRT
jgi:hypothetical protein